MNEARHIARLFKVLSVETRVMIIMTLKSDSLCVGALARHLGVSAAAVSQHLRILHYAGFVEPEKRGFHVHYRVNAAALRLVRQTARELARPSGLLDNYAPGNESKKNSWRRNMCDAKNCCIKPEDLKNKPEECSPEQIKKCHGDEKSHPCASGKKDKE